MAALPKTFDPAEIERRWYAHWEKNGLFRPDRPDAAPWTIVNPPPNVTGSLHIGHALDNTLQDILVRHARLQGKDALWVVGTDHAGIATQMVVERRLEERQDKRTNYSREDFIAKVWEWKEESGGEITRQLRRLGCSMDWSREQFTMDPHFVRAVNKVFVQLYNEGLLYRDKRLVNWDPGLKTAISDLEVEQREVQGKFWHFRYPLESGSGFIAIATTRPETILGDGAVAVHPDDERYAHLVGKRCLLPVVDRLIPIITDEHVRMDFGSGAVKITAAHDWNDYDVAMRHPEANIPFINLLNADATMSDNCPPEYRGLDRYAARDKVVAAFDALGLLDKVEDHVHMVPFGDRSGVVIEPWLTDQWYVDAKTLAGPAIEAVRSGAIRIVPKSWEKTYFNWMENIQPWCVSRQLWWGHRIPAWYGPSHSERGLEVVHKEVFGLQRPHFVAGSFEEARNLAAVHYSVAAEQISEVADSNAAAGFPPRTETPEYLLSEGISPLGPIPLWRDQDVLDTWFSSALWPFATLGWPDEEKPLPFRGGVGVGPVQADPGLRETETPHPNPSPEGEGRLLARHYPNDVLISGFDILFFWDARMIMQGLHFMEEAPFKTLYLHGLVRARDGSKMSKSKGNTVDPLGLIDRYGADALRFFLAAVESQGRDIKMDESRVEGYRNFATKLWNAARFCQANGVGASATLEPPAANLPVNRWIIAETIKTIQALDPAFADLRFDAAAGSIYHFVWDRFCDWYLELIKPVLSPSPLGEGMGVGRLSLPETEVHVDRPHPNPSPEGEGLNAAVETRAVAGWALDQILVMLHPFMPFITEELWNAMGERPYELILARWPIADARALNPDAEREIDWLIRLIGEVRTARAGLNIPPGARLPAFVRDAAPETVERLARNAGALSRLARVDAAVSADPAPEGGAAQIVVDEATFIFPLEGVIDLAAERARLEKGAAAAEKEAASLTARLANSAFLERAKPEAVDKARADHAEKIAEAERLRAALRRLG